MPWKTWRASSRLRGGALSRKTVPVLGPEELTLRKAVRRVARVVGRHPFMFPMPVWFHYLLGWWVERIMTVPLVSVAQVRMLTEGLAEPSRPCDLLPSELASRIPFGEEHIRKGLPTPGPFSGATSIFAVAVTLITNMHPPNASFSKCHE